MLMRALVLSLTMLLIEAAGAAETTTPSERVAARLDDRFAAADVNNDGYLTRPEAQNGFPLVYRHFTEMDGDGNGAVTKKEIQGFARNRAAARQAPPQ